MNKTNERTLRLVTSGVLIALATVLSMVKVFALPYGGSITLFSMVPIMVLGYMYGCKWGLLCGAVSGILQAILGAATTQAFMGIDGFSIVLMALLDYIVAFAVLGLAGMFKNKIKNDMLSFAIGGVVAGLLRLVAHFLSGWILWGSYAEWFFTDVMKNDFGSSILNNFSGQLLAVIYSIVYNSCYMIPEIIVTVIGIVAIMAIKPLRKQITEKKFAD